MENMTKMIITHISSIYMKIHFEEHWIGDATVVLTNRYSHNQWNRQKQNIL